MSRWERPEDTGGTELLLEPDGHPGMKPYKTALVADGIPATAPAVNEVRAESDRELGARSTQEPVQMGPVTLAVLDDTCGNLIEVVQHEQASTST